MAQKHVTEFHTDVLPATLKMVGLSVLTAIVVGTGLVTWATTSRDHLFQTAIERGIDLDSN